MPKNIEFFTFGQLQARWNSRYESVREILVEEAIPVIAFSGGTFRIPVRAIVQLEKRLSKFNPGFFPQAS